MTWVTTLSLLTQRTRRVCALLCVCRLGFLGVLPGLVSAKVAQIASPKKSPNASVNSDSASGGRNSPGAQQGEDEYDGLDDSLRLALDRMNNKIGKSVDTRLSSLEDRMVSELADLAGMLGGGKGGGGDRGRSLSKTRSLSAEVQRGSSTSAAPAVVPALREDTRSDRRPRNHSRETMQGPPARCGGGGGAGAPSAAARGAAGSFPRREPRAAPPGARRERPGRMTSSDYGPPPSPGLRA